MHVISQRMSALTGEVSQLCQTVTKIKDELQTLNKGQITDGNHEMALQTAASKSPSEPKAEMNQSFSKQTTPARATRSRKRKHTF